MALGYPTWHASEEITALGENQLAYIKFLEYIQISCSLPSHAINHDTSLFLFFFLLFFL